VSGPLGGLLSTMSVEQRSLLAPTRLRWHMSHWKAGTAGARHYPHSSAASLGGEPTEVRLPRYYRQVSAQSFGVSFLTVVSGSPRSHQAHAQRGCRGGPVRWNWSLRKPGLRLALALLALAACTPPSPAPLPADLDWVPFYWLTATVGPTEFRYGAIVVEMDSLRWRPGGLLQLDLAGSGTMPKGFPERNDGGEAQRSGPVSGLLAATPQLRLQRGSSAIEVGSRQIGTIGLPLFQLQTLFIDFSKLRIAAGPAGRHDRRNLARSRVGGVLDFDGDRLFLMIGTPSRSETRGLLDTGLVPFELWTTRHNWERWTGKRAGDPSVRRYLLPTSRDTMVFAAADAQGDFVAAGKPLGRREIVFLESGPPGAALEDWPFPVESVLGAAFFARAGVLVLDPQNRQFTLIPPCPGR